jgi:3-ketosteroid 9alpha-monooxygenase subunit A
MRLKENVEMGNEDRRGFPYLAHPTGWFQLGWSADFLAGEARPIKHFSQDLVAYRGASGAVRVFDAFCPHFGAHLGHGGCVEGDDIICPFHAWRFDGEGLNVDVPYSRRRRTANRLTAWPVAEHDGIVFVWHDADGGPPRWDPPEVLGGEAVYPGDYVRKELRMYPQMMVENAADLAHLKYVHRARLVPKLVGFETDGHRFRNRADYPTGGYLTNELSGVAIARSVFRDVFDGMIGGLVFTAVTPIDHEYSNYFVSDWALRDPGDKIPTDHAALPSAVKRYYAAQQTQAEPDWQIWEHMRWRVRPATTPEETEVFRALRDWATQFYPDASAAADSHGPERPTVSLDATT